MTLFLKRIALRYFQILCLLGAVIGSLGCITKTLSIAYIDNLSLPTTGHAVRNCVGKLVDFEGFIQLHLCSARDATGPKRQEVEQSKYEQAKPYGSSSLKLLVEGVIESLGTAVNSSPYKNTDIVVNKDGIIYQRPELQLTDLTPYFAALDTREGVSAPGKLDPPKIEIPPARSNAVGYINLKSVLKDCSPSAAMIKAQYKESSDKYDRFYELIVPIRSEMFYRGNVAPYLSLRVQFAKMMEKVKSVAADLAQERHLDLILDSGAIITGQAHITSECDLTDRVIAKLKAKRNTSPSANHIGPTYVIDPSPDKPHSPDFSRPQVEKFLQNQSDALNGYDAVHHLRKK